jgi:hypothetical protein
MTALVAVIHDYYGGIYEMKVVDGRDRPGHDDQGGYALWSCILNRGPRACSNSNPAAK